MNNVRRCLVIVCIVGLAACGKEPLTEMTQTEKSHADIAWHKGNVEQAFALAKQDEKPLFFYWGAEWCPPCQEIKNTVFKHPKFITTSQLFVPVYLDGDTEQAQFEGERFSVQGYPTMIVFNSHGEEITRIPGGIDTRRYLDVLALSLSSSQNMDQLIQRASDTPAQLNSNELTQLAFYSWGQGNIGISDDATMHLLRSLQLIDRPEDQLAISRLLLTYLSKQVDLQRDDLTGDEKLGLTQQLHSLLDSSDTVLANIDYLSFYPEEIITLLDLPSQEKIALIDHWQDSVARQRNNPLLSKAERLGTWLAPIHFYWIQNPDVKAIPEALSARIIAMVEEMNNNTQGDERQSVINRAGNVLRAAKLYPQATELILAELQISSSPYYFMSSLAEIAEETGDGEGVVEWRRKAYEAAAGKATRFQWGVEYVSGLIEYNPQKGSLIAATASGLLKNLDRGSDVYSGRNLGRLNTLLEKMNHWQSEEREDTLSQFVTELRGLCSQTEIQSMQQRHCTDLLAHF